MRKEKLHLQGHVEAWFAGAGAQFMKSRIVNGMAAASVVALLSVSAAASERPNSQQVAASILVKPFQITANLLGLGDTFRASRALELQMHTLRHDFTTLEQSILRRAEDSIARER